MGIVIHPSYHPSLQGSTLSPTPLISRYHRNDSLRNSTSCASHTSRAIASVSLAFGNHGGLDLACSVRPLVAIPGDTSASYSVSSLPVRPHSAPLHRNHPSANTRSEGESSWWNGQKVRRYPRDILCAPGDTS